MTASVHGDDPGGSVIRHNDSQGLAVSGVIKASACVFFEVLGYNNSGSTRYFQLFDSATVPADTAVPMCAPIGIPAFSAFSMRLENGFRAPAGLSWASSSTLATKTVSVTPDMWVTVTYK